MVNLRHVTSTSASAQSRHSINNYHQVLDQSNASCLVRLTCLHFFFIILIIFIGDLLTSDQILELLLLLHNANIVQKTSCHDYTRHFIHIHAEVLKSLPPSLQNSERLLNDNTPLSNGGRIPPLLWGLCSISLQSWSEPPSGCVCRVGDQNCISATKPVVVSLCRLEERRVAEYTAVVGASSPTDIQWIPFLMFETLNSCRRKLVCAKIMPNVGKNLSWCALLPTFKKNQKRKLVSSQIRLAPFPHLRGQLWGVTTSQIHSLLSIFWHVALHRWGTIAYR